MARPRRNHTNVDGRTSDPDEESEGEGEVLGSVGRPSDKERTARASKGEQPATGTKDKTGKKKAVAQKRKADRAPAEEEPAPKRTVRAATRKSTRSTASRLSEPIVHGSNSEEASAEAAARSDGGA